MPRYRLEVNQPYQPDEWCLAGLRIPMCIDGFDALEDARAAVARLIAAHQIIAQGVVRLRIVDGSGEEVGADRNLASFGREVVQDVSRGCLKCGRVWGRGGCADEIVGRVVAALREEGWTALDALGLPIQGICPECSPPIPEVEPEPLDVTVPEPDEDGKVTCPECESRWKPERFIRHLRIVHGGSAPRGVA